MLGYKTSAFEVNGLESLKPLSELISLKGKKALITGAAVGIGESIAYRFAEAGAALELVDINIRGLSRGD